MHENIISYKICSQKNSIVNDDWNFLVGCAHDTDESGAIYPEERYSHRFWS